MVQKLNRLIGRADFRTLFFLSVFTALVTISWAFAQFADESNTVNSYEELVADYLTYRENSYMLAVPSWYLLEDQVEAIESTYGLAGFQNQSDWYFNFNVGERYFTTNSPLAGLVAHGTKLIIYEDMVSGELLVVRDTGTNFVEEIVFKSPDWPDMGKDETPAYLLRELSKRRVVWHVTLKDVELAEEEFAAMLAAQEEEFEGGMMMLMSGGSCSEIVFTRIEKQETNDVIDVGLCIPDGITNVDVFASTNLMTDGYPWVMVATNLSVVTNSVIWSWTNVVETNVFMAAADGSTDSDGDGLTDGREFYLYGTDMNLWDTDGDSYSDGEELQWGTDPLDIQSMPKLGRGVVINEILYNPSGTDAGKEWVEFFNTNRVDVDLSDFRIQVGSNAFGNVYLFPSNTILNSGDFLLVGGSSVANADYTVELNMPNRFSFGPTAGIRLITPDVMSNLVVDACLYAPTNSFGLPTDGFGTDGFAPWAAESFSVKRITVGYDSDQASDWTFTSSPTPTATAELLDIDGDGISNATEIAGYSTTYGFLNTDYNNADTDFDGFSDSEETTNSPPTHPLEFDTDGDAFPYSTNGVYRGSDGDEVHTMGTDPTNPDSDGDGLPDGWEVAMGYNPTNTANGTADADADFDGDGVSNIDEMNQNSDPTDINDFVSQDYRLVLYHLPTAGWQPGQDMGTKTWAGYRFDNVTKTTGVAFVIADGGHTAETFSVRWEEAVNDDETGGRTNIVWATLLPGTSPKMIITDGGTTWPNQNPAERGADLSVDAITASFLKSDNSQYNRASEALNVSNFVTTNELPSAGVTIFSTTSSDPDNFRLEVKDSFATGTSVDIEVQVNAGAYSTYTLSYKNDATFRGHFLRLVTDTSDDAASENGVSSDPDNQTILVELSDIVRLKYSPVPGAIINRELSVARPFTESNNGANQLKHDIREVQLNVIVFQNNSSNPCVTRAQVETDVSDANERFAQSGIRLVANINMGGLGDPGVIAPTNLVDGFTSGGLLNPPNDDELSMLSYKDVITNSVDIFYVATINNSGGRGVSYPVARNQSGNPDYQNWIVVASGSAGGGDPHNLAHELMHILLDSPHRSNEPPTALFTGGTTMNKNVDGTKRIGPYSESAASGVGDSDTTTIRNNSEVLPD